MPLNLDNIQQAYDRARAILEVLGSPNTNDPLCMSYVDNRLQISGYINTDLLTIHFDNRAPGSKEYPALCLSVTSKGKLVHYSDRHISELDAGEGARREDTYMPWTTWLNRVYKECEPVLTEKYADALDALAGITDETLAEIRQG